MRTRFAAAVHEETKVPIGLIDSNGGVTAIEPWIPVEALKAVPEAGSRDEAGKAMAAFDGKGFTWSVLYNGMIGKKEGTAPTVEVKNGKLQRFAIAGKDKQWVWAEAKIDGKTVVVWSEKVPQPVAVRYAFSMNPEGANLYNKGCRRPPSGRTTGRPPRKAGG